MPNTMPARRRWRRAQTRQHRRDKTRRFYEWLCDQQRLTGEARADAMVWATRDLLAIEQKRRHTVDA